MLNESANSNKRNQCCIRKAEPVLYKKKFSKKILSTIGYQETISNVNHHTPYVHNDKSLLTVEGRQAAMLCCITINMKTIHLHIWTDKVNTQQRPHRRGNAKCHCQLPLSTGEHCWTCTQTPLLTGTSQWDRTTVTWWQPWSANARRSTKDIHTLGPQIHESFMISAASAALWRVALA